MRCGPARDGVDAVARLDTLLDLLAQLAEANARVPIVVEGPRDAAALRAFGCRGDAIAFQSGQPLAVVVESIAARHKEIILLPDWDARGVRHFEQLATLFAANGARVDRTFWNRIPRALSLPLKDVESLLPHVERALERYHRRSLEEQFGT
jgi:5S rRNA maturation endonuclease (ribonuclease M5)